MQPISKLIKSLIHRALGVEVVAHRAKAQPSDREHVVRTVNDGGGPLARFPSHWDEVAAMCARCIAAVKKLWTPSQGKTGTGSFGTPQVMSATDREEIIAARARHLHGARMAMSPKGQAAHSAAVDIYDRLLAEMDGKVANPFRKHKEMLRADCLPRQDILMDERWIVGTEAHTERHARAYRHNMRLEVERRHREHIESITDLTRALNRASVPSLLDHLIGRRVPMAMADVPARIGKLMEAEDNLAMAINEAERGSRPTAEQLEVLAQAWVNKDYNAKPRMRWSASGQRWFAVVSPKSRFHAYRDQAYFCAEKLNLLNRKEP